MPGALIKTLRKSIRNETSALALYAPRTILNQPITAARRFAAQDWPLERLRAIGKASGTTLNDVVLAMCSGAMRTYLLELDALPDTTLVSMVPVGLKAKESHLASGSGGNALGSVMVKLGTDLADPADRLQAVHESMVDGKRALAEMTPVQILAMSALGQAPAILGADAADEWPGEAAVQPDHQQRARARARRSTSTGCGSSAPTRCRSRSTGWR